MPASYDSASHEQRQYIEDLMVKADITWVTLCDLACSGTVRAADVWDEALQSYQASEMIQFLKFDTPGGSE